MSEQPKNMKPYSLEDIERYLQGKLSPAEMHELEKAAVQDPFLADAIEGYQATDLTIVKQDLAGIHNRLSSGPAKVIPAVAKQNSWWRVAAAVILLAGTGILGLKFFTGKNNTQELAKIKTVVPLQKDTSHIVAAITSKKDSAVTIQKNDLVANNSRPLPSLKKSTAAIENFTSLAKKSLQPVAALPAKQYIYNEAIMAKDTALFDKVATDMVAANTLRASSAGLLAQANSTREMNMSLNKAIDPALAAKKENINKILADGSITAGGKILLPVSPGRGIKIKTGTINLDRTEMPAFSQAAYLKSAEQAITAIGSLQSPSVTGTVMAAKRGTISIDTPVFTGLKKMYPALPDLTATSPSVTPGFEILKPKKDTLEMLSEIVITGPGRSSKKELGYSATTAPTNNAGKGKVITLRGSAVTVNPIGGWYNFTKYLTDKIAADTSIQKDTGVHGTVEIKMNISESGKVSRIRILNIFNTQLNPVLIKAIKKGPRWSSSDYLEKKDFIFKVDL